MRKKIAILITASVLTIVGSGYAVRAFYQGMLDTKSVRTGRGIVERKEHIVFDRTNNRYLSDDGQIVEREIGSEQYRIYFRVLDFGQYGDRKRKIIEEAERRRTAEGNLRFATVSKDQYDYIQVGNQLQFNNQFVGGDDVMTWGAGIPRTTTYPPAK